jgi:hypothetical protein
LFSFAVAASVMSDNQLQTYFNIFKLGGLRDQKKVIIDEMSIRVIAAYLAIAYLSTKLGV